MRKRYPKVLNAKLILKLYASGQNVSTIAQRCGYPRGHGQNRVRKVLVKAGVYKSHRKQNAHSG
jgi:hypothetical protein